MYIVRLILDSKYFHIEISYKSAKIFRARKIVFDFESQTDLCFGPKRVLHDSPIISVWSRS